MNYLISEVSKVLKEVGAEIFAAPNVRDPINQRAGHVTAALGATQPQDPQIKGVSSKSFALPTFPKVFI